MANTQWDPSFNYLLYDENHFRSVRMTDAQVQRMAEMLKGKRTSEIAMLWWTFVWIALAFVIAAFVYRLLYLLYVLYDGSVVGIESLDARIV